MIRKFIAFALIFGSFFMVMLHRVEARPRHHYADANGNGAQMIGGRPSGCPTRYCGCGLARFLGISDKRLWRAWSWAQLFQRTEPKPGAAAVRSHHVMLLVSQVAGGHWLVRDYNGGRGLSWLHVRSVSGFVFVDPNNRKSASHDNANTQPSKMVEAVRRPYRQASFSHSPTQTALAY